MSVELDRMLEPRVLAARGLRLRVETTLRDWPRLAALDAPAAGTDRQLRIDIAFREDHAGQPVATGELAVGLRLVCQRCLEEMEYEVRARPRLFFGHPDAIGMTATADGFEQCEPEPGTTLRQLLEDELLLAIPAFPVHERLEDCGALAAKLAELGPAGSGQKKASPFAVLAGLKRRTD